MLVETSSASKITTQGNPYIFRISPPSWVEAADGQAAYRRDDYAEAGSRPL